MNDPNSEGAKLAASPRAFRLLEQLGTDPKIYYLSDRPEVRRLGRAMLESERREVLGG